MGIRPDISRRSFLMAAAAGGTATAAVSGFGADPAEAEAESPHAYEGDLLWAARDRLALLTPQGTELLLPLAASAAGWRAGRRVAADSLKPGQDIVIGLNGGGQIDRLWSDVFRVTGEIIDVRSDEVAVRTAQGAQRILYLPTDARAQIRRDHPRLETGYLVDVIGLRHGDGAIGVGSAMTQPALTAAELRDRARPSTEYQNIRVNAAFNGKITYFNDSSCRCDASCRGNDDASAYPAMDKKCSTCGGGCCNCMRHCRNMPFLACGRRFTVKNRCNKKTLRVRVIDCGPDNVHYCDSCHKCGTSPRGRVADLTRPTYVRIGGNLNTGCFTGTVTV